MTKTPTFSQFISNVIITWYQQDNLRLGQIFTDQLYRAGKADLANALINMRCDPFHSNEISIECLDFTERNW